MRKVLAITVLLGCAALAHAQRGNHWPTKAPAPAVQVNRPKGHYSRPNPVARTTDRPDPSYYKHHASRFTAGGHDYWRYRGRNHHHWTHSYWDARYGSYLYWDPGVRTYYYWCAPHNAYYPVSYAPLGTYSFTETAPVAPVEPPACKCGPDCQCGRP